nr:hypothetical protein [Microvirga aerophila]
MLVEDLEHMVGIVRPAKTSVALETGDGPHGLLTGRFYVGEVGTDFVMEANAIALTKVEVKEGHLRCFLAGGSTHLSRSPLPIMG